MKQNPDVQKAPNPYAERAEAAIQELAGLLGAAEDPLEREIRAEMDHYTAAAHARDGHEVSAGSTRLAGLIGYHSRMVGMIMNIAARRGAHPPVRMKGQALIAAAERDAKSPGGTERRSAEIAELTGRLYPADSHNWLAETWFRAAVQTDAGQQDVSIGRIGDDFETDWKEIVALELPGISRFARPSKTTLTHSGWAPPRTEIKEDGKKRAGYSKCLYNPAAGHEAILETVAHRAAGLSISGQEH